MKGKMFVDQLVRVSGMSQRDIARRLGKADAQISAMKGRNISPLACARMVATLMKQTVRAGDLIRELQSTLDVSSDRMVATRLGVTQNTLINWKNRKSGMSAKQLAGVVADAQTAAAKHAHQTGFRPIIEFFPIEPALRKKHYDVIETGDGCSKQCSGLRSELEKSYGIYVFYDGRGKAIYAGQAKKQTIWKEMNAAFNRARNSQTIGRVNHPTNNVAYRPAYEKPRQPIDVKVRLFEIAAYFSAYAVEHELIDDLEALLIRAFPNDLLNYKVERIGKRKKKVRKVTKRK